ncbi:MAG TPA: tRNA (adenosine(37)-N6)-threonylcarbamoyltransferase complex dimerization subunit type 1 TsaB [Methylovirgula sp.]|jgi:tRNA threonylcarbamoyl adenosine modification protein YeaZ|nr:tRNA (adenosine(37)-N6)-threonylcarbamoyltransferase complex dimerization subunit type 1 TsaB [Methylovirgula sp.]
MKILAIDTALSATSACVYEAGADAPESAETIVMQRGHSEALLPMIERVMAHAEGGFAALSRIAVTVGPGSFTGLRIGIAAARAIGIACNVPVVGVATLAALAAPLILQQKPGLVVPAIDARHGNIYLAAFDQSGHVQVAPRLASLREAVPLLDGNPLRLIGSGAPMLAIEAATAGRAVEMAGEGSAPDIVYVARLGLLADPNTPARPLYLKAPDVKVPPPPPTANVIDSRNLERD